MYNPYMYDQERITYPKVGEIVLYTVNKGDNVYRLAKTFNSEVAWIQAMNNLNKDMMIHTDQQLLIPIVYQNVNPMPQPYQRQSYDLYF
ncbi:MAG: LysM peptidoglycan-binding domain-containing protein [Longibaculum sp.]